jgi:hypothetical protein
VLVSNPKFERETTFAREGFNTLVAVAAICALYVGTLYLILHQWNVAVGCFAITTGAAIVLFFTWYKHLPAAEALIAEPHNPVPLANPQVR